MRNHNCGRKDRQNAFKYHKIEKNKRERRKIELCFKPWHRGKGEKRIDTASKSYIICFNLTRRYDETRTEMQIPSY